MKILDHKLRIIPLGIHIDPTRPVDKAIITHAHADHARPGNKKVLATKETIEIMKLRYGNNCAGSFQALKYSEKIHIDGVSITLYPAGHILGSSQVLLEKSGYKTLITGDYKTIFDQTNTPFELVKCDTLITEATFGLPIFEHPNSNLEIKKLISSIISNKDRSHLVGVYSLGKAQRVINLLRENGYTDTIYIHSSLQKICQFYQENGVNLGRLKKTVDEKNINFSGKIILCPPSALRDRWSRRFKNKILSQASGWMAIKQRVKQSLIEVPLIISDHSDWNELTNTIKETGAENIWVTHGREDGLVYWCKSIGLNAQPLSIQGREEEDN